VTDRLYRGSQRALLAGTYVYGDYCSGEIFAWDGGAQSVLLDTTLSISSFGEDEVGKLYVVNLGGTVSRIVSGAPCTYSISPTSADFTRTGGTADLLDCSVEVTTMVASWLRSVSVS